MNTMKALDSQSKPRKTEIRRIRRNSASECHESPLYCSRKISFFYFLFFILNFDMFELFTATNFDYFRLFSHF